MNINATLLVQALNFFIVYLMLRRFLFKPAIAIIEHETAQENSLRDIIEQQKKSLEIQEKERQRHWYLCQEYFAIHQPNLVAKNLSLTHRTDIDTHPLLSENSIAEMISSVSHTMENKIKHVH
jgi:hypothetical protein